MLNEVLSVSELKYLAIISFGSNQPKNQTHCLHCPCICTKSQKIGDGQNTPSFRPVHFQLFLFYYFILLLFLLLLAFALRYRTTSTVQQPLRTKSIHPGYLLSKQIHVSGDLSPKFRV